MNEVERLREWMKEQGYTISSLAKAMSFSYDGVYQALNVRGYLSPNFKWCFQESFGRDLATKLFDSAPESHVVSIN